ncbi:MAG: glycerol-3-phosphate dehydrogenase [Legionellales bacterium RIFCSPHIGHO2_12_FULL_42_9]|nr:MAG: glycerol-3-phosphate dehydrogenase [Legionellales bacterium RIFCSPHIGHO2_12_FULL_42_9]
MEHYFDIVIIGGGINGCGIAADAAMRGLKTLLIEKDDLASKTSSNSSKLIHGGLRYLEQYDFALVKKALSERQKLLQIAPHLVYPIPLVLPYKKQLRPAWLLRIGLFIYDHLSRKNKLPNSQLIRRNSNTHLFAPLTTDFQKGFLFYDCMTDDARLTISNALQAKHYGAKISTHTELLAGKAHNAQWQLTIQTKNKQPLNINTRVVINTAGPWVEEVNDRLEIATHYHLSLIKGSHILIPKLYEGENGYLLQNHDHRVVFVLPYHDQTMVGTTEIKLTTPPQDLQISPEEISYLLQIINTYFNKTMTSQDILLSWSGVRPLIEHKNETPQELSRDYALHYAKNPAPSLVVYGGKITTYRQLACDVVNELKAIFSNLPTSQTDKIALPGSQTSKGISFAVYAAQLNEKYLWLNPTIKNRLLKSYGTCLETILAHCNTLNDLGQHFGHGLYQAEVDYLINQEWAESSNDILWRRTKLGLEFSAEEEQALSEYMSTYLHQSQPINS